MSRQQRSSLTKSSVHERSNLERKRRSHTPRHPTASIHFKSLLLPSTGWWSHVSATRWARWYPSFVSLAQRTPRYGAGPCSGFRGCITRSRSSSGRHACSRSCSSSCPSAQRWGGGKRFHGQHESGTADEFPGRAQAKGQADTEHRVHEAA